SSPFYLSLDGNVSLNILDTLKIDGHVNLIVVDTKIELNVSGTIDLPFLNPLSAVGTFGLVANGIGDMGMYGSIQIGAPTGTTLIENDLITLGGNFLLQINTTLTDQTVQSLEVDADGNTTGNYTTVDIESLSLLIQGSVVINIVDSFSMVGDGYFKISKEGLEASLDLKVDLGAFGKLEVSGAAEFKNTADEGVIFALRTSIDIQRGFNELKIQAGGNMELNNSKLHEYAGVAAGTQLKLELDGKLKVFAMEANFAGGITIENNVFELRIDQASFDFFGVLSLNASGYIRSDGNFSLTASASLDINMGVLSLSAGLSLTVSNTQFAFSFYGALSVDIDLGFFKIKETLAGFSGQIELTQASAYLQAQATIAGLTVSGDFAWSFGAPPVITNQIGDTLYLNMGSRGHLRGDLYKDIFDEAYNITQAGDVLTVKALGVTVTHTGVNNIIANGAAGKDLIFVGKNVNANLQFDGGADEDSFIIGNGASSSIIDAGAGDDELVGGIASGIHYFGGAGNDSFIGGRGSEYIDMGSGTNTIIAGAGNDIITLGSGNHTVEGGAGDDIIYMGLSGSSNIKGNGGFDKVVLDTMTSTQALKIKSHNFTYKSLSIDFDDSLDRIVVKDLAALTKLENNNNYSESWGATDLVVESSGVINVQDLTFVSPQGHLTLKSAGIDGIIKSQTNGMTIVNSGSGALANITVREKDNLLITSDSISNGGLYTVNGNIDVELAANESLIRVESGVIATNSGGNINIVADDVDFHSGDNKISGSGTLTIVAKSSNQNYRLGGAGQSVYATDLSVDSGNQALNMGMQDFASLQDGFSQITIGKTGSTIDMFIGDIEDVTLFGINFDAKLNDSIVFLANTITIVGDIKSSDKVLFKSRLAEVRKTNINNPIGAPDSGVHAKETYFDLTEQLVVTGWIRGDDLVQINVTASTGDNALVTYGSEANSITADQGSAIVTYNNNSQIIINTSHSLFTATAIEAFGTSSSIKMTAGTGIKVLEGAVVAARSDNSKVELKSTNYLHINSGGAVTAGAKFVDVNGKPVAVKTGTNVTLTLETSGEMKLSGAITSSGAMNLDGGGAKSDYDSYFDTIPGKVLNESSLDQSIIDALNAGNINSTLRQLFTDNNIELSNSTINASTVKNYITFFDLKTNQQKIVVDSLSYQTFTGTNFYNTNASSGNKMINGTKLNSLVNYDLVDWGGPASPDRLEEDGSYPSTRKTFEELSSAQVSVVLDNTGYILHTGDLYYSDSEKDYVTTFTDFTKVDWGSLSAPSVATTFEEFSNAYKNKILEGNGYEKVTKTLYVNLKKSPDKQYVETLVEGEDYDNKIINWNTVERPYSDITYYFETPDAGLQSAEKLYSLAQKNAILTSYGYTELTQTMYFKEGAGADKELVQSFIEGKDYNNADLNFGSSDSKVKNNRWV
ncbi:calcium-binding protein, partial [bacterium]|nr:calcium-binding protein [bacterium]